MTLTKVRFQGGGGLDKDFLIIFFILIGVIIALSAIVMMAQVANADNSEHHKHYCYEPRQQRPGCIETEGCNATTCGGNPKEIAGSASDKDMADAEDEQVLDSLNDQIEDQKEEIVKAEQAILDQKKLAGENFVKMNQEIANEVALKKEYRDLNNEIRLKKYACRDITGYDQETFAERKLCNEELATLKVDYQKTSEDWRESMIDKKDKIQEYWDSYDEIQDTEKYYKEQIEKLNDLKVEFRNTMAKTNIISLRISGTCDMTIERHWKATQLDPDHYNASKCLTYRDLVEYDNSIKAVSGHFEDLGWDINRMKPGMSNTYEYYKQFPWALWIIVDPDGSILSNSAVITVQPQDVQWLKAMGSGQKGESIDFEKMEQYVMQDIMVSADCRFASVSPKMEAVNTLISHFMKHCKPADDTWQIFKTIKLVWIEGLGIIDERSKIAMNWYAEKAREIAFAMSPNQATQYHDD